MVLSPPVLLGFALVAGGAYLAAHCAQNTTCVRGVEQFWDGVLGTPAAVGAFFASSGGTTGYNGDTFASSGGVLGYSSDTFTLLGAVGNNKSIGDKFRDQVADEFQNMGYDVQREVVKRTPFGDRCIDIEVSKGGVILGGIEAKWGRARYRADQRSKDEWLRRFGDLRDGIPYPVNVVRGP